MLLGGPLNALQNEIQNGVAGNLSAPPANPRAGQFYFDTTVNSLRSYNLSATTWVNLDPSKAAAGSIPNTALTTNPLDRTNHSGTQAASTISNLASTVQGYSLSSFAAPTANIPLAGFTFTGARAPTAPGELVEYSWVIGQIEQAASGISSKPAVRAVAVANVASMSGPQTIDGVALVAGDRVLLTAQTTASQNGPWVVRATAWTRPPAGQDNDELITGALWLATEGTLAATQWRLTTTGAITPGTTAVSIVQFGAAASYTVGNGLTLTGNSFAVGAGNGILSTAGQVAVDPAVVGRKTVGTITGDGATTAFPVTHNLSNTGVIVGFYDQTSGDVIFPVISGRTASGYIANFTPPPASGKVYGYTNIG